MKLNFFGVLRCVALGVPFTTKYCRAGFSWSEMRVPRFPLLPTVLVALCAVIPGLIRDWSACGAHLRDLSHRAFFRDAGLGFLTIALMFLAANLITLVWCYFVFERTGSQPRSPQQVRIQAQRATYFSAMPQLLWVLLSIWELEEATAMSLLACWAVLRCCSMYACAARDSGPSRRAAVYCVAGCIDVWFTLFIVADGLTQGSILLWLPLLLIALVIALLCRRDRRAIPPHCCQGCGYDLTGNTSGACPECGWKPGKVVP
jgi:hypothetical protein